MTSEEIQALIDEINDTLNSGQTWVSSDGVQAGIDHTKLRRRRAELQRQLDDLATPDAANVTGGPFRRIQL